MVSPPMNSDTDDAFITDHGHFRRRAVAIT
jgi:hypothetical protein